MTYLPFILPLLWIAHALWCPVRPGKSPRSTILAVYRAPDGVLWDGTIAAFAHVQERGEFRLYKLAAALIGAAVLGAAIWRAVDPLVLLIAGLFGMVVIEALARSLSVIDVAGHGAEIMAARAALPDDEAVAYALRESRTVADQYDIESDEAQVWLNETRWLARIVYRLGKA